MAYLKMPEVNHVIIAGNLTKDPVIRKTPGGIPVINFCLASNHRYRDAGNQWAEEVCYVGVVAWSKLADSCMSKLRKGSAVLVDGELQSRTWHVEETSAANPRGARTVVEIKAHRIQFLNKQEYGESGAYSTGEEIEGGLHRDFSDYHEADSEKSIGGEFEYSSADHLATEMADGFSESRIVDGAGDHGLQLKLRHKQELSA